MKYAIVYSSRTGNTSQLARTISEALPPEDCLYFGPPSPEARRAPRLYVGFWTDRGTCDGATRAFLTTLSDQEVFLFGTAGFGGAPAYFEQILSSVQANVPASVRILGRYMCQGKMPQAVRQRYEAMEDGPRRAAMLENFDRALSHPDQFDLNRLSALIRNESASSPQT